MSVATRVNRGHSVAVTNPSPIQAGAFDRVAPTYGRIGPPLFEYFGERVIDLCAVEEGSLVLDIACGAGAASRAAIRVVEPGGRVVGVDLSFEMLRQARANMPQPLVVLMDGNRLAIRPGVFDVAVSNFSLTFFSSPAHALSEWRRALRSGGRLGVVVHEGWWYQDDPGWSWFGTLLERVGVRENSLGRHYQRPADFKGVLAAGGFGDITTDIEPFTLSWTDSSEWWTWCWSHGFRRVLERLPPSSVEWLRAEAPCALADERPHAVLPVLVGLAHA